MPWDRRGFHNYEQTGRRLAAKRDELMRGRGTDAIAVERTPDLMDQLVLANERDLTADVLNREALLLRQVSQALERIETATYGVCLHCGEAIAERRLAALPWAALCLSCQEGADSGTATGRPPVLLGPGLACL